MTKLYMIYNRIFIFKFLFYALITFSSIMNKKIKKNSGSAIIL